MMDLQTLRYFTAVSRDLNFSQAARRLHISQPALSRRIKELETQMGGALFERRTGGLALTPAGKALLAWANDLLDSIERKQDEMRALLQPALPVIKLGYLGSCWGDFLTRASRRLMAEQPGLNFQVHEENPAVAMDRVESGGIDLLLAGPVGACLRPSMDAVCVAVTDGHACLPDGHRLAKKRRLDLRDLENEDWISFEDSFFPGCTPTITQACRSAGFEPRIARTVDNLGAMVLEVASGNGITLCASTAAYIFMQSGIVLSKLKPPGASIPNLAVWNRHRITPHLMHYVEILKEQGAREWPATDGWHGQG